MQQQDQPEKIRVFPIADPQDWYKNRDAIKKTILAAINPGLPGFLQVKHSFSVDPVSGWIRYSLDNDLWNDRPKRSLPQTPEDAQKVAEKFIAALKEQCIKKEFLKLNIAPLLPDGTDAQIEFIVASPVFHLKKNWVDHWLCRFRVLLNPFETGRELIPVCASSIDVRIGQNGKVVAFSSQWRPAWIKKSVLVDYVAFNEGNNHQNDHEDQEEIKPQLVYELDGENCPQNFICPYYLVLQGHHGGTTPASAYSLSVRFSFVERTEGGCSVFPILVGGLGEYTFNWAYWRPDEIFDEGIIALGEKDNIELDSGNYNLMIHVLDKKTGVVRLFESMAYVKQKTDLPIA